MNNIKMIVLAVSLAFSAGAIAANMSKIDYTAAKEKIAIDYKADKTGCASLSGNAKDVCGVEADAKERIARADLEAVYTPTSKNRHEAHVAKAEAQYAVAAERCDDAAGNAKDVCLKEAKSAETALKADSEAEMKISKANATAKEKTADAQYKAGNQAAEARKDAAADKLDAEYEVAKEKCDVYASEAKDHCVVQAKARFGKS